MTEEQQQHRSWYVTRDLSLGGLREDSRCVRAVTAAQAVDVIKAGRHAVLPAGAWDLADEVLWRLDYGPCARTHFLFWARTGRLKRPLVTVLDDAEDPPRQPTEPTSGSWPDPPDGDKTGPWELLDEELAHLAGSHGLAYRYKAVLRLAEQAVKDGMHARDALRRMLDLTAAQDEALDALRAESLRRAIGEEPEEPDA